jgi:CheY-like chemotaxis protein
MSSPTLSLSNKLAEEKLHGLLSSLAKEPAIITQAINHVQPEAENGLKDDLVDTLPHVPRKPGILVVDDEARVRAWMSVSLPQNGFTVQLAASGPEAVQTYRQRPQDFDLVVLDVHMPEMDGPQTLLELQRVNPKVTCCFLSEGHTYSHQELLARGGMRVFEKIPELPVLVQALWFLVANVEETHLPEPVPATPLGEERRARVRYLCHLTGSCQPVGQPTTGETWIGKLRDISTNGLCLLINRRFEVGTLLTIEIPRPNRLRYQVPNGNAFPEHGVLLLSRVVRVAQEPFDGEWEIGCSLPRELSHEELQRLL